jgi:uncharacterized coiled-coil protein SlyX
VSALSTTDSQIADAIRGDYVHELSTANLVARIEGDRRHITEAEKLLREAADDLDAKDARVAELESQLAATKENYERQVATTVHLSEWAETTVKELESQLAAQQKVVEAGKRLHISLVTRVGEKEGHDRATCQWCVATDALDALKAKEAGT